MTNDTLVKLLEQQGFSKQITHAFKHVDRALFVPGDLHEHAYMNHALPLAPDATISQPSTIAFMLSLLRPESAKTILEIGSGSGYVLALLSKLAPHAKLVGMEIHQPLVESSKKILKSYPLVAIHHVSGDTIVTSRKKHDRILISAALPSMEQLKSYTSCLTKSGILVAPVHESIVMYDASEKKFHEYPGFAFVPLR